MALTIVLADDHQIVRQGLRAILEAEPEFLLVGEASQGEETVGLVEKMKPDVVVLDLMMPQMSGLEVTRQLIRKGLPTRVVILSMHSNEAYVVEALRAGASGYVLKESSAAELVQAIREVHAGKRFFGSPISDQAISAYLQKAEGIPLDPLHTLTSREREVLQLTAEGNSGIEISERLFISPRTVETHRANIMRKLGVRNQKELVRLALQRGLIPLEHGKFGKITDRNPSQDSR